MEKLTIAAISSFSLEYSHLSGIQLWALNYRFHGTRHAALRLQERGISEEYLKAVIRSPASQEDLRRGRHGGMVRKFRKTDMRTLVVVAEIKGPEAWLLTAYYED